MGVFDTYGNTQIKAGEPWQNDYRVGDFVSIPDGVYFDFEDNATEENRAVVIKDHVFIGEFNMFDYWGEPYVRPQEPTVWVKPWFNTRMTVAIILRATWKSLKQLTPL